MASIVLHQKSVLKLAWVPPSGGMTVGGRARASPTLNVIPPEGGTHASLREDDVGGDWEVSDPAPSGLQRQIA